MFVTYGLLFAAFGALYAPSVAVGRDWKLVPWQLFFAAALAHGLVVGLLGWLAVAFLLLLWLVAAAHREHRGLVPGVYWKLIGVAIAMALALHAIPGFDVVVIASAVRLTPDSAPMTLKANFDKGAAGLLLLAHFTERPTPREWPMVAATGLAFGLATGAVVIGIALAIGAIRIDPKWPSLALQWLPTNLFLTCVFEEALFRGLVQKSIADSVRSRPQWRWLPIGAASALFGLAHAGGGVAVIVVAALAGVGYGLAVARTGRVEAAVLAHFVLNSTHFFLFTYPYAAR
jgi:uncharacterized protein